MLAVHHAARPTIQHCIPFLPASVLLHTAAPACCISRPFPAHNLRTRAQIHASCSDSSPANQAPCATHPMCCTCCAQHCSAQFSIVTLLPCTPPPLLQGNPGDYYNARNSLLHELLGFSGLGIPISLCTVHAAVCQRMGIPVLLLRMPMVGTTLSWH